MDKVRRYWRSRGCFPEYEKICYFIMSQCSQVPHSIAWFIYILNVNVISASLKRQEVKQQTDYTTTYGIKRAN